MTKFNTFKHKISKTTHSQNTAIFYQLSHYHIIFSWRKIPTDILRNNGGFYRQEWYDAYSFNRSTETTPRHAYL